MLIVDLNDVLEILINNKERSAIIEEILKLDYYYLSRNCKDLEKVRKDNE